MNNNKKWLAIAILVVVAAAAWFLLVKIDKKNSSKNVKTAPIVKTTKTDVDFSRAPEKFPAEIPIEKDANITQNYNATTTNGIFQATRVFESSKASADNFSIYKDFMTKNGWQITSTIDKPNLKSLVGTKGAETLLVNITENTVNHKKTVSINYSTDTRVKATTK